MAAPRPAAPHPVRPTSPTASFAPIASQARSAKTLLNLGRHFSIPRHDWPLLCRRLDEILSGQLPLIQEGSTQLEEEAQRMAERLLEGEADVTGTAGEASSEDLQTVEVDSVELIRAASGWSRWAGGRWSSWGWWSCWVSWG